MNLWIWPCLNCRQSTIILIQPRKQLPVWWQHHASENWLSPRCSFQRLLSNITNLLTHLPSEYSWALGLVFDWIKQLGNSPSAKTKIFQNQNLLPDWIARGNVNVASIVNLASSILISFKLALTLFCSSSYRPRLTSQSSFARRFKDTLVMSWSMLITW